MLEYDRIDMFERIGVDETDRSREFYDLSLLVRSTD